MNYLIQRGKVRQQAINVPDGLPELLSDITREVLRCQPTKECLCQFIIDYLHSVIVTREKSMVAKSILDRALRQVDSIISDLCVCDLSKEKSDMMGQVMEECFRNFLEKRRCEMRRGKETIKFADIDMLEELIKKCHLSDEELQMSRPAIESAYKRFVDAYMAAAKDTQGTEILYQYFRDRELKRIEEMMRSEAATTIQAAWRGYIVRRTMAQHVCVCTCMLDDQDEEDAKRHEKAARVIQRFFRTLMARQSIKPMGDPCLEKETPSYKEESVVVTDTVPTEIPPTEVPTAGATEQQSVAQLAEQGEEDKATEGEAAAPPAEGEPAAEEPKVESEAPKTEESPEVAAEPEPTAEEPPPAEPAPAEEAAPPAAPPEESAPPAEESAPPPEEAPPAEAPPEE